MCVCVFEGVASFTYFGVNFFALIGPRFCFFLSIDPSSKYMYSLFTALSLPFLSAVGIQYPGWAF